MFERYKANRAAVSKQAYLLIDAIYKQCTIMDFYSLSKTALQAKLAGFNLRQQRAIMKLVGVELTARGVNYIHSKASVIFAKQ